MMFTLAICTYNRADLLDGALRSLSECTPPTGDWELLLIDNNSSDHTPRVAEQWQERLPLRYVHEAEQGLSAARNRALRECRGEVILFTDDDVRFQPQWLASYEQAFSSQPDAGWFGGRILPLWDHGPPRWLRDPNMALIAGLLVNYDLGDHDRAYCDADSLPFGASFALRRTVFECIEGFRTDLGVKGTVPGRSEETEYLQRVRAAGIAGWYVGASHALHWQNPDHFRWSYLYRYGIQKGLAESAMGKSTVSGMPLQSYAYALKAAWQLLKGRGDRARQCVINMGIQRGVKSKC